MNLFSSIHPVRIKVSNSQSIIRAGISVAECREELTHIPVYAGNDLN